MVSTLVFRLESRSCSSYNKSMTCDKWLSLMRSHLSTISCANMGMLECSDSALSRMLRKEGRAGRWGKRNRIVHSRLERYRGRRRTAAGCHLHLFVRANASLQHLSILPNDGSLHFAVHQQRPL